MAARLNRTTDYYAGGGETLGWELTVCNALEPENSPCRRILKRKDSYGNLLYEFLALHVPLDDIRSVIEIGGGYGVLMRDFLAKRPLKATMLDISPTLSRRQRETLRDFPVTFLLQDFLDTDPDLLKDQDLAVLNENLGDFPTLLDIGRHVLRDPAGDLAGMERRARDLFDRYQLEEPETDPFHLNLGALEALEKLCLAGVP
ncbi:MAG: hypothetical protein JW821_07745, partial [Deltaproteobacteria bacterium]|nr:hypothetical protein [Deltaproteobacteria bacterium]